jgi:C4-dicarboxylate-specific signal transduction histidine kinase
MSEDQGPQHRLTRVVVGELAGGVTRQMVRPLRELREDLAVLVESLDRHMMESRGPKGLSYHEVESMRHTLADCYLRCRDTARLASDLAQASSPAEATLAPVDLNKLVESALNLARHRIKEDTEVFVDLGSVPLVRGHQAALLLAISQMIAVAAESAARAPGSALSIKTRSAEGKTPSPEAEVVLLVADNGGGHPSAVDELIEILGTALEGTGGHSAATSQAGAGSAFELRFPSGAGR